MATTTATNLEAVPCMLRNGDGTTGVYGLLIRPVASANTSSAAPLSTTTTSSSAFVVNAAMPQPSNKIWTIAAPQHPPVSGNKVLLPPACSGKSVSSASADTTLVACSSTKPMMVSSPMTTVPQALPQATSSNNGSLFIPASTVYQYQQSRQPQQSDLHQLQQQPSTEEQQTPLSCADSTYWTDMSMQPSTSSYDPRQLHQLPVSSATYNNYQNCTTSMSTCYPYASSSHAATTMATSTIEQQQQQQQGHIQLHNNGVSNAPSGISAPLDLLDDMDLARLFADSESLLAPDCHLLDQNSQITTLENGNSQQHLSSMTPTPMQHSDNQMDISQLQQLHHQQQPPGDPNCYQQQQQPPIPPSCKYQSPPQQQSQQQMQATPFVAGPSSSTLPPPPPRPQLDWEQQLPNDSSGTPDSGIQSISGSPGRALHNVSASPLHSPTSTCAFGYLPNPSLYHGQQHIVQQTLLPPHHMISTGKQQQPLTVRTYGAATNQFSPNSTTSSSARSSRASRCQPQPTFDDISDADQPPASNASDALTVTTAPICETVAHHERPTSSSSSAAKVTDGQDRAKKKVKRKKRPARGRTKSTKSAVTGPQFQDMPRLTPENVAAGDQTSSRDSSPERKYPRPSQTTVTCVTVTPTVVAGGGGGKEVAMEEELLICKPQLANDDSTKNESMEAKTPAASSVSPTEQVASANEHGGTNVVVQKELSLDTEDPETLVEKLLSKFGPDQIKQFTNLVESKLKAKDATAEPKARAESQPEGRSDEQEKKQENNVEAIRISTKQTASTPEPESEKDVLKRLRAYRSKARKIIDPALIESVFELGSRLGQVRIGENGQMDKEDMSRRHFKIDWTQIEGRRKKAEKSASDEVKSVETARALSNLENEADSSDEESEAYQHCVDHSPSAESRQGLVEITENPAAGNISVRIKLGSIKAAAASVVPKSTKSPVSVTALPPKKRIKIVPPANIESIQVEQSALPPVIEQDPTTTKYKRKRKKYPWDRKRTKRNESVHSRRHLQIRHPGTPPLSEKSHDSESPISPAISPKTKLKYQLETQLAAMTASPAHNNNLRVSRKLYPASPSKKKFCKAGIYWNVEKHDESENETLKLSSTARMALQSQDPDNFLLPFDIWSEFTFLHSTPGEYKKIRSCVIVDQPPSVDAPIQCTCVVPTSTAAEGCGDNCLNRIVFAECSTDSCPCGDRCGNRRIQKHRFNASLERFDTGTAKGLGVRTKTAVEAGTYLCEYVGEVVSSQRFRERMSTWYKNFNCHYALSHSSGFLIDAYRYGSLARFVNHCCRPNCEIQKWNVNGQYRLVLVAQQAIDAGTEVTYDYRFQSFDVGLQRCLCGVEDCRRRISSAIQLSPSARWSFGAADTTPPSSKSPSTKERATVANGNMFLWRNWRSIRQRRFNIAPDGTLSSQSVISTSATSPKDPQFHTDNLIRLTFVALRSGMTLKRTRKEQNVKQPANKSASLNSTVRKVLLHIAKAVLETPDNGRPKSKELEKFLADKTTRVALRKVKNALKEDRFIDPDVFDRAFKKQLNKLTSTVKDGDSLRNLLLESYEKAKANNSRRITDAYSQKGHSWDSAVFLGPSVPHQTSSATSDQPAVALTAPSSGLNQPRIDQGKLLTTRADLSYLDDGLSPVGDWDADKADGETWVTKAAEDQDWARCICGISEEDGEMIQCDGCAYWLHLECVGQPNESNKEFICHFCAKNTGAPPISDIVQKPQPQLRLENCTYYRSLVHHRRRLQIRLNECVYVKRKIDEKHKAQLKRLHEECVKGSTAKKKAAPSVAADKHSSSHANAPKELTTHSRSDLRVFRIERLFVDPSGHRFVFGCYYARPHETFCEPSRLFYRNELFWTPLYDTLPIEAIVARCAVLDPFIYVKGRQRYPQLREEDVYICEFKVDKSQRLFERITGKQRYFFNTAAYVFRNFPEKLKIVRNFTPFLLPSPDKAHQLKAKNNSQCEREQPPELKVPIKNKRIVQESKKQKRLAQLVATLANRSHTCQSL